MYRVWKIGVAVFVCLLWAAPPLSGQIILDTFTGTAGTTLPNHTPDINLPGGTYQNIAGSDFGLQTITQGSNQVNVVKIGPNAGEAISIASAGSYTQPGQMTISAGLSVANTTADSQVWRGVGVGFYSATNGGNGDAFFTGVALNPNGTITLSDSPSSNQSQKANFASVAWTGNIVTTLGAFSTTTLYTISYTIDTTAATGGISNVTVTNTITGASDSVDFAAIDNYNGTNLFTPANTAYAGFVDTAALNGQFGYVSNFQLSAAGSSAPPGSAWTGTNSTVWANAGNWSGAVPGATTGTANTDTATFNAYNPTNPTPVVDAGRNLQNIVFDNSTGNLTSSLTLGTTTGNALLLTSTGMIQTTGTVANSQTINAPLVLEGAGGTYTFQSGASSSSATLNFGGGITAGANSGTTTLQLAGFNNGANTISGVIANGAAGATLALTTQGGSWVLAGANTFTGATTVSGGTLRVGNGTSGSLGATPISVTAGQLILAAGGSIGNASITVTGPGTFAVQPGSGTLSAGTTGAGSSGATLSLGSNATFSMVDGAIGTFNLQQQASFGATNTALTLGGATLKFELASTGADKLAVNVGAASVSGTNNISITTVGSNLTNGTFTLISTPAGGLNGGTFQFTGGGTTAYVAAGSNNYQLTLNSSSTIASVTVAPSNLLILDTFTGASGTQITAHTPDINVPGGIYVKVGGNDHTLTGNNQVNMGPDELAVLPISSNGNYTKPPVMTISAELEVNNTGSDSQVFRGIGLGFYASTPGPDGDTGFNGLVLSPTGTLSLSNNPGPTQSSKANFVTVPWPSGTLGAFSTTTAYTVSYTVNTAASTGGISGVSVTDPGTGVTDTADFALINSYNGNNIFTDANTAFAGYMDTAALTGQFGYVSNFQLSAAGNSAPSGSTWSGTNSTVWSDPGNWTGTVPGATSGTTNTDTATFNTYNATNPTPLVDTGRNLQNIVFDNSGGNLTGSLTLGTTAGKALLLTSGGTIQTTFSVANPQSVNAPLVLEGSAGTYTFSTNGSLSTATLNFGGPITAGASSGTTTLTLAGTNNGANTIGGAIGGGAGATLALSVSGGSWVLAGANTFTGSTSVGGGSLRVGNGTSGSLGATPISVTAGQLILATGGSIGNTSITVTGPGSFAAQPGSGTLSAGTTGTGSSGATLSLGSNATFSMVDGAIGTFNLQQQASFGAANTALTLGGATLKFELASTGADKLAVNVGQASVSGTNNISITTVGSSLTNGTYPLISVPAGGLNGGTFQFSGGGTSAYVAAGGNYYQLTLNSSSTSASVTVAPSNLLILDTFTGTAGTLITAHTPDINVPGGSYVRIGGNDHKLTGSNQVDMGPDELAVLPISSAGNYMKPPAMTISAGVEVNTTGADTQVFRGVGLGFYASTPGPDGDTGFNGLVLSPTGTLSLSNNPGPTQSTKANFVTVAWPSTALGAFSTTTTYTVSYTVDTTAANGGISGVSVTNTSTGVTDTADFADIDNYSGQNLFSDTNTAFAGYMDTAALTGQLGYVSNFQLSAATGGVPSGSAWTGTNSTVWSDPGNWTGTVPGATTGTTNTDTALFNAFNPTNPTPVVDLGRNLQNIVFDNSTGGLTGSLTLGTTTGNPLLLTAGGAIQTTASVANPQTVKAPLVLEGNYTFTSGSTASSATLTFGGGIAPDSANSGLTTLTLNGANTGTNTIAGVLADNGSAKLAIAKSDGGTWRLTGANTFTGGISVSGGTLRLAATSGTPAIGGGAAISGSATLELAGSVFQLSQSVNIANTSSATAGLLVSSSTAQKVGTILGTGNTVVNTGASLTAYQIRQNSLTIAGTGKVTLSPSGSGSTSAPAAPNNINFSSNVNSLTLGGTTDAWTGTLDIGNNALVIPYGAGTDPYTTLVNMVKSAYGTGTWNGTATGITSSLAAAAANSAAPLNIGLRDFKPGQNGDPTSLQFAGQTITTSAVLVRLTYMDDLILAGDMQQGNATSDALRFAANYGTGTTWSVGDLNHDGVINTGDALIFAANYVTGLPSLDGTTGNAAMLGSGPAAVPEPCGLALAVAALLMTLSGSRLRRRIVTVS